MAEKRFKDKLKKSVKNTSKQPFKKLLCMFSKLHRNNLNFVESNVFQ